MMRALSIRANLLLITYHSTSGAKNLNHNYVYSTKIIIIYLLSRPRSRVSGSENNGYDLNSGIPLI